MFDSGSVTRATQSGSVFHENVQSLDTQECAASREEITLRLNRYARDFVATAFIDIVPRIHFGDVRSASVYGNRCHLQQAHVSIRGNHCDLLFDTSLLEGAGKLIFVAKSWVILLVLSEALHYDPTLQATFEYEIGDAGYLGDVAVCSSNPHGCLIPDSDFAATDGYASYREFCNESLPVWRDRTPKIFWRGSTTGQRLWSPPDKNETDDLRWLPRLALCIACREPDLVDACDVGITNLVQVPEQDLQARIVASGLMKDRVPRQVFLQYRGAFDIDGNSNAWSGLFCALLGGLCVYKIASLGSYRQWYYDKLEPWVNYIPIRSDLSDLREVVDWFRKNQAEAGQIASRGRALAVSIGTRSAIADSANALLRWLAHR